MTIDGCADHFDVFLRIKKKVETITNDRMFICQDDGNHECFSLVTLDELTLTSGIFTSILVPFLYVEWICNDPPNASARSRMIRKPWLPSWLARCQERIPIPSS